VCVVWFCDLGSDADSRVVDVAHDRMGCDVGSHHLVCCVCSRLLVGFGKSSKTNFFPAGLFNFYCPRLGGLMLVLPRCLEATKLLGRKIELWDWRQHWFGCFFVFFSLCFFFQKKKKNCVFSCSSLHLRLCVCGSFAKPQCRITSCTLEQQLWWWCLGFFCCFFRF
jgi:hypothetical protein